MLTLTDRARNTTHILLKACSNISNRNRQAHLCKAISPENIGYLHFPFSKFRHCYLSLQSPVSSFPHGTCLLLVSNIYSALDEVYHPLHAPIPRNMTLRRCAVHWELQMTHRIVTLVNALFQGLIAAPQLVAYLNPTIQDKCLDFQTEPVLMHSPLLKESLWVSHPPPTYMLKFSGLVGLSSCFERIHNAFNSPASRKARCSNRFKHYKSIAYEWHTDKLSITDVKGMTALTCKTCNGSAWLCHSSSLMFGSAHWNRQAFGKTPKAQCAFKLLLNHEILLLSMFITFCCTLHHHPSQGIQCWKLWWQTRQTHPKARKGHHEFWRHSDVQIHSHVGGLQRQQQQQQQQTSWLWPTSLNVYMETAKQHIHICVHDTKSLCSCHNCANDPSAGSPTETLLRLLLPLSDKVH